MKKQVDAAALKESRDKHGISEAYQHGSTCETVKATTKEWQQQKLPDGKPQ